MSNKNTDKDNSLTNERFEADLHAAFDKYAKERLSAIGDDVRACAERTNCSCLSKKSRERALSTIMLAACIGALMLALFMFARVIDIPDNVDPLDTSNYNSVTITEKPAVTESTGASKPPEHDPYVKGDEYAEGFFEPNRFFTSQNGGGINSGGTGEFADPETLKKLSVFELSEDKTDSSIIKYSNSAGYYGTISVYLSSEVERIPAAISYRFESGRIIPTSVSVSGITADGSIELLHSYICPSDADEFDVSFYIGLSEGGKLTAKEYKRFRVSFFYSTFGGESKNTDLPEFVLYFNENDSRDIPYTNYCVKNGDVCDISSNQTAVSVPASFGGMAVESIYENAFSGAHLPGVTEITIPEGVKLISASAFCGLDSLQTVNLPSTLTPGFVAPADLWNSGMSIYREEIAEFADKNGDSQIGRPFCTLFIDCPSISWVNIAENNDYFSSVDGKVYTNEGVLVFVPSDPAFSMVSGEFVVGSTNFGDK